MNSNTLEIISQSRRPVKKPVTTNAVTKFSQQKIDMEQAPFFFPPGYENIFLTIYFLTLPYVMGLMFLFFYVAEANTDMFVSVTEKSSYLLTWAIGYEVLAALFFIFILKLFIDSIKIERQRNQFNQRFRRP